MKKIGMMSAVLAVLLMLTGCWDQDLLKNARLLYGGGFDLAPNGKLLTTFVIRDMPESEQQSPKNEIIYAVGNTPREARDKADDQLSRLLRTYRNRFVLLGEELAKQDIFPILDIFYRDPKSALNARIGVTQGKATDMLSLKKVGNVLIEEEIDELIKSNEETTTVPKVTLEKIYPVMLDPGEDFVLPYLMHKGNRVDVSRIAMFHDQRLTGVLSPDESTMCLVLQASKGKLARFTQKISAQNGKSNIKDFITFNVDKSKREMEVSVQPDGQISVKLDLNWKASVEEYPKDHLNGKTMIAQLNQLLSKEMTDLAKKTLKKMQNARCDGLGIARQLMAYHPETWKKQKENWGSHYQKVKFDPNIQVEIRKKGIIN
ncbi:Ger(x)C family spore germination protein [Brevibacillus brevis]|uniref:Ger(x)C family spore germination protein n=2 Tax=Brevibacillus brevis TaxID=1393 RepID=UPI001157236C|nr:Ger(x)C family spore germination protein [Lysinibacillus sp. SDF0063]TQR36357.1 Ger(x)C family spore germination protein [Lysinibacillus sp. SDF0063]